jgi:4-oxalocrotonate tautomerase
MGARSAATSSPPCLHIAEDLVRALGVQYSISSALQILHSPDQTRALIQKITDAVASVTSEKLRDVTWVIVREVPSGNWGIGGAALGLDDVKKIIAGT